MEYLYLSIQLIMSALLIIVLIIAALEIFSHLRWRKKLKTEGYYSDLSIIENGTKLPYLITHLKGKLKIMALSMTDSQKAIGTLTFVDKHGHPTDVPDGNVTVTSSDVTVATATYEDATNKITVVAVAPGIATLSVSAKNSKGEVLPFEDTAIEIKGGEAVGGSIVFEEPTEQDAEAPAATRQPNSLTGNRGNRS